MKNALQLVVQYEPLPETFVETRADEEQFLSGFTTIGLVSSDQFVQEQVDELQTLVGNLREQLAMTQWDLSQKEALLHSCLQREMELRAEMKGVWQY